MGKVLKKKVDKNKKSLKKKAEETQHVIYDDDEGAEDKNSSNDEDEEEEDERRRHRLLEAISALGGQRKRTLAERSEAAVQMSEFTVSAKGTGVQLSDLVSGLDQNPAIPSKTKKQLRNLQRGCTVESPLSRQQTERILRNVSFQKAAAEVSRWKSVIQQNQRAEQLVFPLNQESSGPRPMERMVTGWKAQTPLEQEIFALLSANKQPVHDPVLTPAEEASLQAMSLEDAKIRRAELQKARALQSYYEAKARRERKIKSKKFHRVQNKAKRKDLLKQFDHMVATDPAAALEELNRMELNRMKERMSLKHQNSGKWAKSKAIMAKYDQDARKAMQQQLEVNKQLTQRLTAPLSNHGNEEEEEEEKEEEVLPDFVNDAERGGRDASNPWMSGKLSEEKQEEEEKVEEEEKPPITTEGDREEEEEEEELTEEEALLREFDRKRKRRQAQEEEEEQQGEEEQEVDEQEVDEQLSEFRSLIADARREAEAVAAPAGTSAPLEEGLLRIQTLEDVDLLHQEVEEMPEKLETPVAAASRPAATQNPKKHEKRKGGVELKEVLTKKTKVVQVPLAPTVQDSEESEEELDQRGLIKEAFAGDDVVSDFLKDKRQQEEAATPQQLNLTLPGWGEWGGTGLKPSRSKRRRFSVKRDPPPPRKDGGLLGVIISEKRDSSVTLHQVNSLPTPFQNHAQFEGTIRCPLGRHWNTERTVKKVTKPRLLTQMGAIIEPMAKEELLKGKKKKQ